jgi:CubicO group peptidase (beta-lactamase class C family)
MNSSEATSILDQLIPTLMREADVPGLAIAFIKAATVVWKRNFGVQDKETQAPIEHDTIFGVASLSKPVFAYGVLQLCEKGVLQLDTPLSEYFPIPYTEDGFDPSNPRLKLVTARQVLSHSAGFGNWRKDEMRRINFTPGEKFSYAGEGYLYLQRVIEHLILTCIPLCTIFRSQ